MLDRSGIRGANHGTEKGPSNELCQLDGERLPVVQEMQDLDSARNGPMTGRPLIWVIAGSDI